MFFIILANKEISMAAMSILEGAKSFSSYLVSCISERIYTTNTVCLPGNASHVQQAVDETVVKGCYNALSLQQREQVHNKIWELAKMNDLRVDGCNWGGVHVFDDVPRLSTALQRLGFFQQNNDAAISFRCLPFSFGEGGLGSQYFSISGRAGKDPLGGDVGYVNGMGIPSLAYAEKDAKSFSNQFADKNNIHCVYNATHQATPFGHRTGLVQDIIRMKAVDGGSYTKTSCLIAQQWIDFLDRNPLLKYLQVSHSEGAAHINAALRMIAISRPDLLSRIRVITFCPAHFILPETYGHGLQVINLFKTEDGTINPWAAGIDKVGVSPHIVTVRHGRGHPHNHLTADYVREGKPYVDQFMRSGNIY
jgi:hypothetical protein